MHKWKSKCRFIFTWKKIANISVCPSVNSSRKDEKVGRKDYDACELWPVESRLRSTEEIATGEVARFAGTPWSSFQCAHSSTLWSKIKLRCKGKQHEDNGDVEILSLCNNIHMINIYIIIIFSINMQDIYKHYFEMSILIYIYIRN